MPQLRGDSDQPDSVATKPKRRRSRRTPKGKPFSEWPGRPERLDRPSGLFVANVAKARSLWSLPACRRVRRQVPIHQ